MVTSSTYTTSSLGAGHIRVVGHEVIGDVTSAGPGTNLAGVYDANPACWLNSRLNLVARAYEKYRYNRCIVEYQPAIATSTSGSTVIAAETDADENLPSGPGSTQRALNSQFAALSPVWQHSRFEYRRNPKDHQWYLASQVGEASRSNVTQFLAYSLVGSDLAAGTIVGRVVFHYDVEFIYPELELAESGEQFTRLAPTTITAAGGAGDPIKITPPVGTLIGSKIAELRLTNNLPSAFVNAVGDWFDVLAGAKTYVAWNGTDWILYASLAAAIVAAVPLRWTSGQAALPGIGYFRPLTKSLNTRP